MCQRRARATRHNRLTRALASLLGAQNDAEGGAGTFILHFECIHFMYRIGQLLYVNNTIRLSSVLVYKSTESVVVSNVFTFLYNQTHKLLIEMCARRGLTASMLYAQ